MPKNTSLFVCQNCAATYPKWQGQCESCGEWGSIVEETVSPVAQNRSKSTKAVPLSNDTLIPLTQVQVSDAATRRIPTGIFELDRVLGGGMVPGAVMLIGGEPGIGKSTLLTQMMLRVLEVNPPPHQETKAATTAGKQTTKKSTQLKKAAETASNQTQTKNPANTTVLYVSGEESPSQIALRINRFIDSEYKKSDSDSGSIHPKKFAPNPDHILFETSTLVETICQRMAEQKPKLVIVDSIQTVTTPELTGAAGSVGQLREVADQLTIVAKQHNIPTFLVGHVTKEGTIAGPKVLEHIVDAVLELSGERTGQLRILRAIKNRFGATDEVGVFRHTDFGLEEVSNPSDVFIEQAKQSVPGSVVVCILEGTRPILVEVQALVVSSQLAMPRRVGRGIELSRIQVLSAVLQKHARIPLGSTDIFLNAAGGLKITEPAVDLGLAVAMASSLKNKAVPPKTAFIGEVGLLGEIRAVSYLDKRIKEAKRLGYTTIISRESHQRVSEVLTSLGL